MGECKKVLSASKSNSTFNPFSFTRHIPIPPVNTYNNFTSQYIYQFHQSLYIPISPVNTLPFSPVNTHTNFTSQYIYQQNSDWSP